MADEAHEQIHVDAPPARCFERAAAFDEYPDWTNDVKQATVLVHDEEGRATQVAYRAAALGRSVRYVLDYDFTDAPRGFSWSLVEGDMLRALDGEYGFTRDGDGTLRRLPPPRRSRGTAAGSGQASRVGHDHRDGAAGSQTGGGERDGKMTGTEPNPHPDAVDFESAGTEERPLPPPSVLESVITELLGAVPEVRDHVLEAADALLDAAKALIDAADRVVRQQRGDE